MEYIVETVYPYKFYSCKTITEARKKKTELRKKGIAASIVCKNENGNDYIVEQWRELVMVHFGEWLGKSNADSMLAELLMEDLTMEQFRAIWTTYCILLDLEPDTAVYDKKLMEIYNDYWCFEVESYEEYDLFMGALLSQEVG